MPPKLPTQELSFGSMIPLQDGIIEHAIHAWLEETEGGDLPTAAGTRGRGSDAGKCSRQIAFQILEFERQVPIPPATLMAFKVGHALHDAVQTVAEQRLEAEREVVADWRPQYDVSCHGDLLYTMKSTGLRTVGEIKSKAGYGFLLATGERASEDGPGPKMEDVLQAALTAAAPNIDAQLIHMIYLDKDKHGIAEWLIDMDQPFPQWGGSPRELAMAELERFTGIFGRIDDGLMPVRYIPNFGRVQEPPAQNTRNDPWQCRYCAFQPVCVRMEVGATPIDAARLIAADLVPMEG